MTDKVSFGHVAHATVTMLVDNKADELATSTARVHHANERLVGEHGFSALIRLQDPDVTLLWDTGATGIALTENLRRLKLDPCDIQKIALSHGHQDHTGGLADLLRVMDLAPGRKEWSKPVTGLEVERWVDESKIPVVIHPAAFRERWRAKDADTLVGPNAPPPNRLWEDLGAAVVRSAGPCELAPGCWTTGFIPRHSFETEVTRQNRFYREGDAFLPDVIEDDQALIIHVRGKGLVVVAGCAHAGIVNTIHYARELSGVDRVCAILGGFHLSGAKDEVIQQTIDHLAAARPDLLVPCHCTGFHAMSQIAARLDEFIEGVVGATFSW